MATSDFVKEFSEREESIYVKKKVKEQLKRLSASEIPDIREACLKILADSGPLSHINLFFEGLDVHFKNFAFHLRRRFSSHDLY